MKYYKSQKLNSIDFIRHIYENEDFEYPHVGYIQDDERILYLPDGDTKIKIPNNTIIYYSPTKLTECPNATEQTSKVDGLHEEQVELAGDDGSTYHNLSQHYYYPDAGVGILVYESDIIKINAYLFNNIQLDAVEIPSTVTEINEEAFNGSTIPKIYCHFTGATNNFGTKMASMPTSVYYPYGGAMNSLQSSMTGTAFIPFQVQ